MTITVKTRKASIDKPLDRKEETPGSPSKKKSSHLSLGKDEFHEDVPVDVTDFDQVTVRAIKTKIYQKEGIPIIRQRLFLGDKEIKEDSFPLSRVGIKPSSVLHLLDLDLPKDTKIVAAGSEQTDDTEFYLEYDDENDDEEGRNGDQGVESVSDSDEEDDHAALQQRRKGKQGSTVLFAVGEHGSTGMHGSEMVNSFDVSAKYSSKADSQIIPIWSRFVFARPTLYLFFVFLVSWYISFNNGLQTKEARVFWGFDATLKPSYEVMRYIEFKDSTWIQNPDEDSKKFHVEMRKLDYQSGTPFTTSTDSCLIRIVNTCEDDRADAKCNRPSVKSYFKPLTGSGNYIPDDKERKNLLVGKPWGPPFPLPETPWHPVICEMFIIVPKDAELSLWLYKAHVVAKNITLKSLHINGDAATESVPEYLEITTRNISVNGDLEISSASGRISLYELNAGTATTVTLTGVDTTIDITSHAAPDLEVTSSNKAVCFVGPIAALNSSTVNIGNASMTKYTSIWECPHTTTGQQSSCKRPRMSITSSGRGAIAFHALSLGTSGTPSTSPTSASNFTGDALKESDGTYNKNAAAYSGAAFSFNPATSQGHFLSVDHSNVLDTKSELAMISVAGPGLHLGNIQVVWSISRIWFEFSSLWVLWTISLSVVFPVLPAKYSATLAFCPAHGPHAAKDLVLPLLELTDVLGHDTGEVDENGKPIMAKGYWILRNLGGVLDTLRATTETDAAGYVPACQYCDQVKTIPAASGTLFPDSNVLLNAACRANEQRGNTPECSGRCGWYEQVNRYVLVPKGEASCLQNWAVASTLGDNNISFSEDSTYCWTPADGQCSDDFEGYFHGEGARTLVLLSLIISFGGSGMISHFVWYRIFPKRRAQAMVSSLTNHPGSIAHFSETIAWSHYFCVSKHHFQEDLDEDVKSKHAKWLEKIWKHVRSCFCIELGNVRMPQNLHVPIENKEHVYDWTPPDDETLNAEVLGIEFVWRNPILGHSRFEKMTVFDAVSMQLVNKLSWLANLNLRNGEMMPMPVWEQLHKNVLGGPIEIAEDYDNMESEDDSDDEDAHRGQTSQSALEKARFIKLPKYFNVAGQPKYVEYIRGNPPFKRKEPIKMCS